MASQKKFYLISKHELQRIGLRAQIVSFLMQNGLKNGNVVNDPADLKKVIVAMRYESEPSDAEIEIKVITEIRDQLVNYLNKLQTIDNECYRHFPDDIRASELHELNNPHTVAIMDFNTLSSALMLEQTSKGVGAMLGTKTAIEKVANSISPLGSLKELPDILKKMLAKLEAKG